jgi:hypothetical protein
LAPLASRNASLRGPPGTTGVDATEPTAKDTTEVTGMRSNPMASAGAKRLELPNPRGRSSSL